MTLKQLQYVIQVAQCGSVNLAAGKLYISQPSLSNAISELESELGITIFARSNRGVTLTEDGFKFLSYARQVAEQAELLESRYKNSAKTRRVFALSSQHYAFVVNAFVALVKEYGEEKYEFSLREARTHDIIEDVRTRRSELGVIYLSDFNGEVLKSILQKADLKFTPLFTAKPHVFISRSHPLAEEKSVTLSQLSAYPRLTYEQGVYNSFYFSEELHGVEDAPKSIVVSDRATLFNLLIGLNGYTICSGVLSEDLNGSSIISVPLESTESMRVGYISPADAPLGALAERYLFHLKDYISRYKF